MSTRAPGPHADADAAMRRFLNLLGGGVRELRALKVPQSNGRTATFNGYFDDHHHDDLIRCARELGGSAAGVYVTLNELIPDVLLRRANRTAYCNRGDCTAEADVTRRRWVFVDIDPVRPAGIAATDAEKARGIDLADRVRADLAARGWPEPIIIDSGNGVYLLYAVDLPAQDGGLVQKVLAALAKRFDTAEAKIDTVTHDAPRLIRLPGGVNRKGDASADRPHRPVKIVSVPDRVDVVPVTILEELAAETAHRAAMNAVLRTGPYKAKLKVREWLSHYGIAYREKADRDAQGRRVFVLKHCPCDPEHRDPDACVMQAEDGRMSARCFHASCAGKGWKDFKAAIGVPEPHHYDPPLARHARAFIGGGPSAPGTPTSPQDCGPFEYTDVGNARRLVAARGEDLRYVADRRAWFVWDGRRWAEDAAGVHVEAVAKTFVRAWARECAAEVGRAVAALAAAGDDPAAKARAESAEKAARAELKTALKAQDFRDLHRMIAAARSEPAVLVPGTKGVFDRDPWLLTCGNGTVDLRTGELREHRRDDMQTRMTLHRYRPDATAANYRAFVETVAADDPDLAAYLRRLSGVCATGDVTVQSFFLFSGDGANGKSTLIDAWMHTLGEFAVKLGEHTLVRDAGGSRHPTEIADLAGARFAVSSETGEDGRLDEARMKELTGGEVLAARRMKKDFSRFAPTHKLVLATNHRPRIRGRDHGVLRRVQLVPFRARFWKESDREAHPAGAYDPALKADPQFPAVLRAEAEGILAEMVREAAAFYASGCALEPAKAVREASAEYRAEEDSVGAFFDACVRRDPEGAVPGAVLYDAYRVWSLDGGTDVCGTRTFGQAAKARFGSRKSGKLVYQVRLAAGP